MKTIVIILMGIIMVPLYFTACKKDTTTHSDIIGIWNLQYIKSKLAIQDSIIDSLTISSTNGDYIEFRYNGIAYSNNWINIGFNSEHKIEVISQHNLDTFFFKIVNDKLIAINDNISDTLIIIQLTNNNLIIGKNIKLIQEEILIDSNNFIIWDTKAYYIK